MRAVFASILVGAALTAGAAHAAPRACPAGMRAAATAELFFEAGAGRTGQVTDADWRSFLGQEVAPRFPGGLSVSDVYSQRRGPAGGFVRQDAKALFIVLAGRPDEPRRLKQIGDAYKRRFHQQPVRLVEERACVSL